MVLLKFDDNFKNHLAEGCKPKPPGSRTTYIHKQHTFHIQKVNHRQHVEMFYRSVEAASPDVEGNEPFAPPIDVGARVGHPFDSLNVLHLGALTLSP